MWQKKPSLNSVEVIAFVFLIPLPCLPDTSSLSSLSSVTHIKPVVEPTLWLQ